MQPNIAPIAALLGEPARADMLLALLGGKALTATELALCADVTPPTASSHLGKLLDADIVRVRKQGRHKYFQLASTDVAQLLEQLLNLAASQPRKTIATGPTDPDLRRARVCYDHLAGEMGVALLDALTAQGYLRQQDDDLTVTAAGEAFFAALNLPSLQSKQIQSKQVPCKACLDWSERRSHLAGTLGQQLLQYVLDKQWATRVLDSRALQFSATGRAKFARCFGVSLNP